MKTVHELNNDELEELRERYFHQLADTDPEVLGDILLPEELPMENVIAHYEGTFFVEEDFFCNVSINNQIVEAKALLKRHGYQTDNLWNITDVKGIFNCTDGQAHKLLTDSLTNEATMEQIWFSIKELGNLKGYKPVNE
jgi:hypothetical protein